ncbi:MAG: methyl-accepting chemotaxis protein [Gammaproteobacteria bacterium]|nr:methyl-accepting chemotaxis protein [Gammaproteobacteria bacterium]MCW8987354.1 methyl-accepting chemotaxis protein [Gammaproteobacteria bacterium]MCW9029945.1 methyl-accepting chemotaxis protein [Gammaproteobacteria bacterium]
MKKNLPVTDNEISLSEEQTIISTTDLKGAITFINKDFLDISGFSSEELLGVNHNIVRHPDMPSAAFADLWSTLQSGKAWMGMVKNRCKNGDYYWVDAFITPVTKNGEVQGYESTRVKPIKALTERVSGIYAKISSGKKINLKSVSLLKKQIITGSSVQLLLFSSLTLMGFLALPVAVSAWLAGSAIWAGVISYQMRDFKKLLRQSKSVVDNPLMQLAYYGKVDDISQVRLSTRILFSKLRTVIKRIEFSIGQIREQAQLSSEIAASSSHNINRQKQELEMVAAAVNEMTAAVQEVAQNTGNAAQAALDATKMSQQGALTITDAIGIIDSLDSHVSTASASISQVKKDTENIGGVLDVIRGIAEQTNLLALNAAIEAARAGEQGRGFAVVADEVRTLASRSHDATQEIQGMIEQLQQGVVNAVTNMELVSKRAAEGVAQVEESAEALAEISGSVSVINDMNTQIAAATDEQNAVVSEVSRNIEQINQLSGDTAQAAEKSEKNSQELSELADKLKEMFDQFNEAISK